MYEHTHFRTSLRVYEHTQCAILHTRRSMSSLLSAYARGTGNRGLPPRIGHQPEAGTRYTYDPTHFSTHIRAYRRTQSAICLHAYRHTPRPVLTRACGGTRDYRAWYGLGQTYEILQMHFYSLYYFRKATALRPYDARMWWVIFGVVFSLWPAFHAWI